MVNQNPNLMQQQSFLDMHKNEMQRLQQEYTQRMNQLQNSMRNYQGGMNNPQFWQQAAIPIANGQQPMQQQMPQQDQTQQQAQPEEPKPMPVDIQILGVLGEIKGMLSGLTAKTETVNATEPEIEPVKEVKEAKEIQGTKVSNYKK